ncbi:hypothetical protein JWS13_05035 (plasmid) [Rhodococcus pseudokoreensis]|uniref:Uncharacterized protein n=1 Tax=Rhodococcus pseudokoreensis TaxID=2811421 RepID=A0A974VZX6_9NOCA|nr:hypothetical protein [Rhodococcus pseudokoreensis]QSE88100.1 hypothetical protein JWS13_05035 [Rhodococcus pseudokoreensis]
MPRSPTSARTPPTLLPLRAGDVLVVNASHAIGHLLRSRADLSPIGAGRRTDPRRPRTPQSPTPGRPPHRLPQLADGVALWNL